MKGKAAADRLAELGEQAWDRAPADPAAAEPAGVDRPGGYLLHVARTAMACQFEIFLGAGQRQAGMSAALEALDLIDALEDQLSVYREHSELSRLNREAAQRPVEVEQGLFRLLEQSLELFRQTGGAFDITASPLSRAWGFFRRAGTFPSDEELQEARQRVGSQHVRLDPQNRTVFFTRPGIELSLNSIGKGYAVDRAGALLRERGVGDFLFHGGQSSALAAGSDGRQPGGGWTIGLRHPLRPTLRLAEFQLKDRALATSGSGTQFFHHQGRRYGHLLDPRTGRPADGVYSATVLAPTAAEADALSTAFYVLGPKLTLDYCRLHPNISAVLVVPGQRSGTVEIRMQGLDEHQWRRLDGEHA